MFLNKCHGTGKNTKCFKFVFTSFLRFGQTTDDINNDQRSPVFIQFLDALHQIVAQYSVHFEYTVELLSFIAYHVTSCRFGTFLTDNELERVRKHKMPQKTPSIWSKLLNDDFVTENGLRNENYIESPDVLYLDHRAINLRLWDYHCRMDPFPVNQKDAVSVNGIDSELNARQRNQLNLKQQNVNLTQTEIDLKRKDLEMNRMRAEMERLKQIESQYQRIMKCIDNQNGFLLGDTVPIMPDLDYVSVSQHSTPTDQ